MAFCVYTTLYGRKSNPLQTNEDRMRTIGLVVKICVYSCIAFVAFPSLNFTLVLLDMQRWEPFALSGFSHDLRRPQFRDPESVAAPGLRHARVPVRVIPQACPSLSCTRPRSSNLRTERSERNARFCWRWRCACGCWRMPRTFTSTAKMALQPPNHGMPRVLFHAGRCASSCESDCGRAVSTASRDCRTPSRRRSRPSPLLPRISAAVLPQPDRLIRALC